MLAYKRAWQVVSLMLLQVHRRVKAPVRLQHYPQAAAAASAVTVQDSQASLITEVSQGKAVGRGVPHAIPASTHPCLAWTNSRFGLPITPINHQLCAALRGLPSSASDPDLPIVLVVVVHSPHWKALDYISNYLPDSAGSAAPLCDRNAAAERSSNCSSGRQQHGPATPRGSLGPFKAWLTRTPQGPLDKLWMRCTEHNEALASCRDSGYYIVLQERVSCSQMLTRHKAFAVT